MYLNAKTNLDALKEIADNLEVEIEQYQSKLDQVIPKPQKYINYPKAGDYKITDSLYLGNSSSYYFEFKNYYGSMKDDDITEDMLTKRFDLIKSVVAKYDTDCSVVVEQNKTIIAHNNIVKDKITSIMKELGVPDTYTTSEYKSSRSSKPTTTRHYAGYVGDLERLMRFVTSQLNTKDLLSTLQRVYEEKLRKAREITGRKKKEEQRAQAQHEVALLRAKYTPENPYADVDTIRDAILAKDKYLMLGYWLMRNRGDWNDGYSYAETGLNQFSVDNTEDAEICASLRDIIRRDYDSGSVDGRIFRDCEYSYGYLFGKVSDQVLWKDYEKITSMEDL